MLVIVFIACHNNHPRWDFARGKYNHGYFLQLIPESISVFYIYRTLSTHQLYLLLHKMTAINFRNSLVILEKWLRLLLFHSQYAEYAPMTNALNIIDNFLYV